MTLNITKKKIEKVLELFNHPQTRKIRKRSGEKRKRKNKSFNRKNGRKNLATSTLKKRGGSGHPILHNGGTVGVVLGGQVGGGKVGTTIVSKLTDPLKNKLSKVLLNATDKKKALVDFANKLIKIKIITFTGNNNEVLTDLNKITDTNVKVNVNDNDEIFDDDKLFDDDENFDDENLITIGDVTDAQVQELVKPFLSNVSLNTKLKDTSDSSTITEQQEEDRKGKGTEDQQDQQDELNTTEPTPPTPEETKTVETKSQTSESKEIDTSEMLKVALASNYFTQYGILSGMLKMNQDKNLRLTARLIRSVEKGMPRDA